MSMQQDTEIELVFRRRPRVRTHEGGWAQGPEEMLPVQLGRFVQSGRVGATGIRHTGEGRLRDVTATIVMLPGSNVKIGDLVDIPPHGVGGDPGIAGEFEVFDISGRWAMNVEVIKHAE